VGIETVLFQVSWHVPPVDPAYELMPAEYLADKALDRGKGVPGRAHRLSRLPRPPSGVISASGSSPPTDKSDRGRVQLSSRHPERDRKMAGDGR